MLVQACPNVILNLRTHRVAKGVLVVAGYMKQVQKHLPILVCLGNITIVLVNAVKTVNALIM